MTLAATALFFSREQPKEPKPDFELDEHCYYSVKNEVDFVEKPNARWFFDSVFVYNSKVFDEKLLFDTGSPHMQHLKQCLRNVASGHPSIEGCLQHVVKHINALNAREHLSLELTDSQINDQLSTFLYWRRLKVLTLTTSPLIVDMEEVMSFGLLVCRHKALIAAELIADLVQQQLLPMGKVYSYHINLGDEQKPIKHVFALYCTAQGEQWLIDPMWRMVKLINTNEIYLKVKYGDNPFDSLKAFLNKQSECSNRSLPDIPVEPSDALRPRK